MRFMRRQLDLIGSHRYDEIRAEYVTQLVSALVNDTTTQRTWARVSAVIDRHSRGDLEHVTEALSLLWNTINQRGDATSTASFNDQPSVRPFPAHRGVCIQP
jgi:hypothetical protein